MITQAETGLIIIPLFIDPITQAKSITLYLGYKNFLNFCRAGQGVFIYYMSQAVGFKTGPGTAYPALHISSYGLTD